MKSFNDWYREAKKLNNDGFSAKDFFKAGQKTKQDEVDELQMKLSEDSRVLHNVIDIERRKCEELQKRIDRAVKHIEDYYGVVELSMIVDILNGDQS